MLRTVEDLNRLIDIPNPVSDGGTQGRMHFHKWRDLDQGGILMAGMVRVWAAD